MTEKKLVVISWNLANAFADERSPQFRFGVRKERILDNITRLAGSGCILCLQEIRQCKEKTGNDMITPLEFVKEVAQVSGLSLAGLHAVNPDKYSFYRATLFDADKFFCLTSFPKWVVGPGLSKERRDGKFPGCADASEALGPAPKAGVMFLFSRFTRRDSNGNISMETPFWVINCHFPIPLETKLVTIKQLAVHVEEVCKLEPVIVIGDCNVFMDDGGQTQLDTFHHLGFENVTLDSQVPVTFSSFPHDRMNTRDAEKKEVKKIVSHLDYAFIREEGYPTKLRSTWARAIPVSEEEPESDHFPLVVGFEFQ